jgi:hypothetical protein
MLSTVTKTVKLRVVALVSRVGTTLAIGAAKMKLTIATLVVVLVGWVTPGGSAVRGNAAERTFRPDASTVATYVAAVAAPAAAPALVLSKPYKKIRLPKGCNNDKQYDVVVHFHGVPERVFSAYEKSGLDAVLVVTNLGAGSGRYEDTFANAGSFKTLLQNVQSLVEKHCGQLTRGRVAISSWSAGYGAPYRILAHAEDAALVDAVLLADGLHAGYEPSDRRKVSDAQMEPFAKFAQRAANGDAVMVITHSSIVTPKYASTTQTAAHLAEHVGAERSTTAAAGPRDMQQISTANAGGFSVRGFSGNGPDAHCDHLYALDALLFAPLAQAWN